jgi:hypothetical protein
VERLASGRQFVGLEEPLSALGLEADERDRIRVVFGSVDSN